MKKKKLKFLRTRRVVPQSDMSPDYNEYVFKDIDTGADVRFKETRLMIYARELIKYSFEELNVTFSCFITDIEGKHQRYFILGGNAVIRHDKDVGTYENLSRGGFITLEHINKINSRNDLRMAGMLPEKKKRLKMTNEERRERVMARMAELTKKGVFIDVKADSGNANVSKRLDRRMKYYKELFDSGRIDLDKYLDLISKA